LCIPATVVVIEDAAFEYCSMLEEVLIDRGSCLELVGKDAFAHCGFLQPIDIPSRAKIYGDFKVIGSIVYEDGSKRKRVHFPCVRFMRQ
jgi:hypothetical protein